MAQDNESRPPTWLWPLVTGAAVGFMVGFLVGQGRGSHGGGSAETEQTGKLAGTDLRAGGPTLPLLYLRRAAETDAAAAGLLERVVVR